MDRVKEILQQIHSTHFATLWLFYRKHFPDDGTCLQFLYDAILFNPFSKSPLLTMDERMELMANGQSEDDETHSIPLKMLNTVQRLVNAAHDMDQIRRGKDVFKVIFLVTCEEVLEELSGRRGELKKELSASDRTKRKSNRVEKYEMWKDFWTRNAVYEDKQTIRRKFSRDCLSEISEAELKSQFFEKGSQELYDAVIKIKRASKKANQETQTQKSEPELEWEDRSDTFELFLDVMHEVRNSAIHDGAYWEHFFNNHGDEPLQFQLNINLHCNKDNKKRLHTFLTELSYQEFEDMFVRTSIRLIRNYVTQHTSQQEEPSHADA